jgi:hypothetical protein
VSVIVVLEPDSPDVLVAHRAAADPDIPGHPGRLTACGIDTSDMDIERRRTSRRPGDHWYPAVRNRICHRCDRPAQHTEQTETPVAAG